MLVKEYVTQELDTLSETQLQQVAEYLAFLKFQARVRLQSRFNAAQAAALYTEFAQEDRRLAEEGIKEYSEGLLIEDIQ